MQLDQLIDRLNQMKSETNLPGHTEVMIEDDAADIYGIGDVLEVDGRVVISTGDIEMEDDED
jgi:hypothetical protein